MADLKKELDEYLLLKGDARKPTRSAPAPLTALRAWLRREPAEPAPGGGGGGGGGEWCECWPSMTRAQRLTGFALCLLVGLLCFALSAAYVPVLLLRARKFALLYTLGSLFVVFSFSFLWGPLACVGRMFSRERLCLTLAYGTTLLATLYCALHLQSTPLTVLCAAGQVAALLWTLASAVPGGTAGIKLFSRLFSRTVTTTLPV